MYKMEAAQHVKSDTREQLKRHEEVGTDSITLVCAPAVCYDRYTSSVGREVLVILHFASALRRRDVPTSQIA